MPPVGRRQRTDPPPETPRGCGPNTSVWGPAPRSGREWAPWFHASPRGMICYSSRTRLPDTRRETLWLWVPPPPWVWVEHPAWTCVHFRPELPTELLLRRRVCCAPAGHKRPPHTCSRNAVFAGISTRLHLNAPTRLAAPQRTAQSGPQLPTRLLRSDGSHLPHSLLYRIQSRGSHVWSPRGHPQATWAAEPGTHPSV